MGTIRDNARYMQIAMRIERRKFNDNHGAGGRFASDDATVREADASFESQMASRRNEQETVMKALSGIPTTVWKASLTPTMKSIVKSYAQGSAFAVNAYLRTVGSAGSRSPLDASAQQPMGRYTKNLDAALALPDAVTHADMTAYRGFGNYNASGVGARGSSQVPWPKGTGHIWGVSGLRLNGNGLFHAVPTFRLKRFYRTIRMGRTVSVCSIKGLLLLHFQR